MEWLIIEEEKRLAQENMDKDLYLLKELKVSGPCFIHFYDWSRDAVTYGYFIDSEKLFLTEAHLHFDLAKRPTGGGVVFHRYDFAFSILVPEGAPCFSNNVLDNYAFVNKVVIAALDSLGVKGELMTGEQSNHEITSSFCMATPTKYDVMIGERKIGGAAQRKTKKGFLHQGVIFLREPDREYLRSLLKDADVVAEAIHSHGGYVFNHDARLHELDEFKQSFKEKLIATFIRS